MNTCFLECEAKSRKTHVQYGTGEPGKMHKFVVALFAAGLAVAIAKAVLFIVTRD